jgi:hypothetical protein
MFLFGQGLLLHASGDARPTHGTSMHALIVFCSRLTPSAKSVAFFSKVDVDKVLRKEVPLLTTFLFRRLIGLQVNLESVTPSNPIPLPCGIFFYVTVLFWFEFYCFKVGESLSIYEVLKKTNGSLLLNKQPPLESTEAVGSFSE